MVWSIAAGLGMAAYYSVIAVAIYVFAGAAPFAANNATLAEALVAYWVGGLLGGALLGLIKPLARNTVGAVIVGILVAAPVCAAIALAVDAQEAFWPVVAIMSVIFGTIGGRTVFHTLGPGQRELEQLEEMSDRLLAGELSEDEIRALEEKYERENRRRAARASKQS